MRQAGTIPDLKQSERFANYLVTLGISGRIEETDNGYIIWVHDDNHWERSREELAAFLADPNAERYVASQRPAEELRKRQRKREEQYRRNVVDVRQRWRPWTEGRFPFTCVLIAISVALTALRHYGAPFWVARWLYFAPLIATDGSLPWPAGSAFQAIAQGQVWRLVTPIFLHGDLLHLAFNMYWTYQFGALLETRRGTLRLIGFVLVVAICSNVGQALYAGPAFGGMSGVGYGMFGYIWIKSRFDPASGIYIDRSLVFLFMLWFVLCFFSKVMPIANTAHAVGLVTGALIGYAPVFWRTISGDDGL